MMEELISELTTRGVSFVKAVDISMLSLKENKGYNIAILIGILLSPGYIFRMSKEDIIDKSEFTEKELKADQLAEWTAGFIIAKGYSAFAQSERNLNSHGFYDKTAKTTQLPHKKIAILAGLGWIGKNNLLVTQEYGCAMCMSTILTNAKLSTENKPIFMSNCEKCSICKDICPVEAIHGATWEMDINRDSIVNVYQCVACLKCLVHCPWSQKYMENNSFFSLDS